MNVLNINNDISFHEAQDGYYYLYRDNEPLLIDSGWFLALLYENSLSEFDYYCEMFRLNNERGDEENAN